MKSSQFISSVKIKLESNISETEIVSKMLDTNSILKQLIISFHSAV